MAQDLGELLDEARGLMNDVDADLITDRELKRWLNEGLAHLTLRGQMLEDLYQFTTEAGEREYPLPFSSGDVKDVWYYTGSRQRQLDPIRLELTMEGSRQTSGIITHYYKRLNTHTLISQDDTGAISRKTKGTRTKDRQPRYVLGLYPTPSDAQQITVRMGLVHPQLRNVRDQLLIPFEFHFGPVAYALFKAYSKEKAYAEARHYAEVWQDMLDKVCDWKLGEASSGFGEVIRERDIFDTQDWPGRVIID